MSRIGLFGGTFDPPHVGHLVLAEWARARLRLDRVVFMPAGTPPHKRGRPLTGAAHRLAMTRLAVRGNPAFAVSDFEARRHGPSFTVDTLRDLRVRHPGARLFLLMGADSLADFPVWHEPAEIARLATLVVAARPGARRPARVPRGLRIARLDNPVVAVSSSALRARARAGRSLRYLVPDPVAAYIARHGLYGRPAAGAGVSRA
jgi:nicotinate-nucleotide adenylyltransferase